MTAPDPAGRETLRTEAARWFARMRGPGAEESRNAFEAWLSSDPLHREAYNRSAEIFAMGKLLAEPGLDERRNRRARFRGGLALAVVAAALIAAIACWPVLRRSLPEQEAGPRATQPRPGYGAAVRQLSAGGEDRSIRLADGSVVRLQSAALVIVRLTPAERVLTLEQGTARFFVAHEQRPFVVNAGGGSVTARGTVFDVGLTADRRVIVRLIQGTVDIRQPAAGAPAQRPARRLHAGQSLSFSAAPTKMTPDDVSSGYGGSLPGQTAQPPRNFDSIPLADLIRIANRGSPRPIRLADPATGRLRVSGKFRVDDTGLLADRLAILFGIGQDRRDPRAIVLRAG